MLVVCLSLFLFRRILLATDNFSACCPFGIVSVVRRYLGPAHLQSRWLYISSICIVGLLRSTHLGIRFYSKLYQFNKYHIIYPVTVNHRNRTPFFGFWMGSGGESRCLIFLLFDWLPSYRNLLMEGFSQYGEHTIYYYHSIIHHVIQNSANYDII